MDVERELRFWFKEMGIYKEIKNSTLRRNKESHSWRQTLKSLNGGLDSGLYL